MHREDVGRRGSQLIRKEIYCHRYPWTEFWASEMKAADDLHEINSGFNDCDKVIQDETLPCKSAF